MHNIGLDKKRSKGTSLLKFYEMVTEIMDRGCTVDMFYFDLVKGFDPLTQATCG